MRRRGVYVAAVFTMKSHPPMLADELRRQADVFTDLAELKAAIGRGKGAEVGIPVGMQEAYEEEIVRINVAALT